jgi:23S rRNA (uracil1939-C5)-methyltransferase
VEVAKTSEIRFGEVDSHPTLGSFSQANSEINEKLCAAVVAGADGAETSLDLYAGAGNFAFPLVKAGLGVTAVEADIALVSAARERARSEGVAERLQVIQKRVEVYLKGTPAPTGYLVADPPRAGLGPLAEKLTFAPKMALISCDLAVAVRDLNALGAAGWTIETIHPFDMFPQTGHIELLTLLTR